MDGWWSESRLDVICSLVFPRAVVFLFLTHRCGGKDVRPFKMLSLRTAQTTTHFAPAPLTLRLTLTQYVTNTDITETCEERLNRVDRFRRC